MSRFTGYTGVTNYLGAKFTADGGALLPIFSHLKFPRPGFILMTVQMAATLTKSIARAANLPSRTANIIINGDQTFSAIQQSLSNLEILARKNGFAIGTGAGLAETIDAVETWSRELHDRGFLLVPLSLAYRGAKS